MGPKPLFAVVCCAVAALVLVVGGGLVMTDTGDGFIPHLGLMLGGRVLALGNFVSLFLNLLYRQVAARPAWLTGVIGLQAVAAVITLGVLAWPSGI